MIKVSVVVISYNVDSYINVCLNSIINQTFKDIEIICVDDGSKDHTLEKLKLIAKEDERIKIIAQNNQGPFAARMNGLRVATGAYVIFVDGDDWIDCREIEAAQDVIEKYRLDVVFFDYIKEYKKTGEKERYPLDLPAGRIINRDELRDIIYKECMGNTRYSSMCTKMYRISYLRSLEFPLQSDLRYGEDLLLLLEVYDNLDKTFYINEGFYHYYVHSGESLSNRHTDFNIHKQLFEVRMKYAVKWKVEEYAYANFIYSTLCEIIYKIKCKEDLIGIFKYIKDDDFKVAIKKENEKITIGILRTKKLVLFYKAIKIATGIMW